MLVYRVDVGIGAEQQLQHCSLYATPQTKPQGLAPIAMIIEGTVIVMLYLYGRVNKGGVHERAVQARQQRRNTKRSRPPDNQHASRGPAEAEAHTRLTRPPTLGLKNPKTRKPSQSLGKISTRRRSAVSREAQRAIDRKIDTRAASSPPTAAARLLALLCHHLLARLLVWLLFVCSSFLVSKSVSLSICRRPSSPHMKAPPRPRAPI